MPSPSRRSARVLALVALAVSAGAAGCGGDSTGVDHIPASAPALTVPAGADVLAQGATASSGSSTTTTDTTSTSAGASAGTTSPSAGTSTSGGGTAAGSTGTATAPGHDGAVDLDVHRAPVGDGRRDAADGHLHLALHGRRDRRRGRQRRRLGRRLQPVLPGQPGRLPGELARGGLLLLRRLGLGRRRRRDQRRAVGQPRRPVQAPVLRELGDRRLGRLGLRLVAGPLRAGRPPGGVRAQADRERRRPGRDGEPDDPALLDGDRLLERELDRGAEEGRQALAARPGPSRAGAPSCRAAGR